MTRPHIRSSRPDVRSAGRRAIAVTAVAVIGLAACADGSDDETAATDAGSEQAVAAPAPRQAAGEEDPTPRITVDGEGEVSVRPDTAEVRIGVRVDGDSAQTVLDEASAGAADVIDELEAVGIPAEDIRTTQLSVFPRFGPEGGDVTGYEASNLVNVTIREIDRAGEVIDAAADAAGEAVTIEGISFSVSDPEAALAEARTAAVEQAAQRASDLAAAAGLEVGAVISISQGSGATPGPLFSEEVAADAAVPIEPGSQTLRTQVTVVYELVEG